MPPELLDGSDPEELGFAVDIFSLGTLCWEASCWKCTGQPCGCEMPAQPRRLFVTRDTAARVCPALTDGEPAAAAAAATAPPPLPHMCVLEWSI